MLATVESVNPLAQKQYVAKPGKVLGEQFDPGASPLAVGACTCGLSPIVASGPPHAHIIGPPARVAFLNATDWIITNTHTAVVDDVLTDAQFQDLYGPGGALSSDADADTDTTRRLMRGAQL
jgi:hypothetical protein